MKRLPRIEELHCGVTLSAEDLKLALEFVGLGSHGYKDAQREGKVRAAGRRSVPAAIGRVLTAGFEGLVADNITIEPRFPEQDFKLVESALTLGSQIRDKLSVM